MLLISKQPPDADAVVPEVASASAHSVVPLAMIFAEPLVPTVAAVGQDAAMCHVLTPKPVVHLTPNSIPFASASSNVDVDKSTT